MVSSEVDSDQHAALASSVQHAARALSSKSSLLQSKSTEEKNQDEARRLNIHTRDLQAAGIYQTSTYGQWPEVESTLQC